MTTTPELQQNSVFDDSEIAIKIEKLTKWAKSREIEAEQLARDSVRMLSCTGERLERISRQGFFQRCWCHFSGESGAMELANIKDLITMQQYAFEYINMLVEQEAIQVNSMLSIKSNLELININEENTRKYIELLAKKTQERFKNVEDKLKQVEVLAELTNWVVTLKERKYNELIPETYLRLLEIVNDFYRIKSDSWNHNDMLLMKTALRDVGLDPDKRLSIGTLIDALTTEIRQKDAGFNAYKEALSVHQPEGVENYIGDYSEFATEAISSPVFVAVHGLKVQFIDKTEVIEVLSDEMRIAPEEALRRILRRSISNMNVNLNHQFSLAETAIEILLCMRLASHLAKKFAASKTGYIKGMLSKFPITRMPGKKIQ